MAPGATLVVMSSIPVGTARAQAAACAARGISYVDAPVSGGERGAKEGTLAIMAGGDAAVVAALGPVFAPLGRATHVGPVGSGQLAKLANQLIVASSICAVAEALLLAERGGADPAQVREALMGGFADSTVLRQHGLRMVEGNFVPGGPAKYQIKDTGTALALAAPSGSRCRSPSRSTASSASLVAHGGGDLDHSAAHCRTEAHEHASADRDQRLNRPAGQIKTGGIPYELHSLSATSWLQLPPALLLAGAAEAEMLTLSTPDADTSEITLAAKQFAELVTEKTGGELEVRVFPERNALRRRSLGGGQAARRRVARHAAQLDLALRDLQPEVLRHRDPLSFQGRRPAARLPRRRHGQ